MTSTAVKIDKTTSVNLGILITLLSSSIGGALYLSALKGSVDSMQDTMSEVKASLDRNTLQIMSDGREAAAMRATIKALERRIEALESR